MFTTLATSIASGIIVVLYTSWYIWKKREKLILSYTITESDLFPFQDGQGKYYALKISNNGGKLIKYITADIHISDSEIDKVTSHDLITDSIKNRDRIKFKIEVLNPKEKIDFIITSKVTENSKLGIKIRGEGVNAEEQSDSPSKADLTTTATIWGIIGFCFAIVVAFVLKEDNKNPNDRIDNLFSALNKAKLPHIFHEINSTHDDLSYEGTAYYLMSCYLKDPGNKEKYINALKNITDISHVAPGSKAVAFYLLYKICQRDKNILGSRQYLEKCKSVSEEMYEYLIGQDQYYNIDSLQNYLLKDDSRMTYK